ncbi:NLR family CARD domain-containing protein 3 isoform X2 [Dunckerocampus dactyliophorus]|uniref:NLR family CARD domain-containing protein 3 isoform X2 n=1 Tax=Dunckerocampus dactyliophorus TaxID=161453 RepID=UPI0024070F8D|nr:NLR family CARD domain-containing protein 3 isoform X2 [Dunckerocampus dactyliophorus]
MMHPRWQHLPSSEDKTCETHIMERKAHYGSVLDRSKAITWQGDCYVDLQSTPCSPSSITQPPALDWVQTHQDHLRRFTSASFLEGLLLHLRKTHLLSSTEETRIKEAGQLEEQINMLISTISGKKDSHGSEAIRDFIEGSDCPVAQLIKNYDSMVKDHKEELLRRCEHLRDRSHKLNISRGLLLVDGLSDLQHKEHDLTQVGATRGRRRNHLRELGLNSLLEPLTRVSLPPRVSLTIGVGGIGKTTRVQRFIRQWIQGAVCPDVSFVLPFTFSQLNFLEKLSAERLVKIAFPHLSDPSLILSSSCRTLLIFDGLDDFRCTLNFSDAAPCDDPKKEVPIEDLVTNIIRGNLLPGVALWVTSRPTVASLIPGGLVDRVTEVPGFSPKDIHGFLNHHIPETDFANKIWTHLQSHKNLMVFCYTPSFCFIVADTLKYMLQSGEEEHLPRTCTELYAHFCGMKTESGEPRGREPVKETLYGSNRKLLGNLGRLAFYGLLKYNYTFSEQDLRAYGIDLLLSPNSLVAGLLIRDETILCTTYHFTHLTLQEFLAATFYYVSSKRAIFDLFSESTMSWPKIGFLNHFKSAIQRSQQAADGHLDVFARFLSGLLCPLAVKPLAGLLGKVDGSQRVWAAGFLHSLLDDGHAVVSHRVVNLVYCLQEMQHTELLRAVEDDLRLGSLAGKLTRAHCVVLGYLLHVSPECGEQTNLKASLNYATMKCLLPQLLYCSHLRLESNHFKDDVMELLGSLLSAKDCHIQKISLADNDVSSKGVRALSRALMVNRTLTSLNLRNNNIGSKGAKLLAEALKMNQVLLSVNFQNNSIEEEGAWALAEVLECNRKLASLSIRKNGIGANGAKRIADALKANRTLTKLTLCSNQLGDKGTVALAEALTVNHTLLSLQLQSNSISNEGMTALTKALRLNRGLVSLNLRENSIGIEGAKNMARALHENNTLQDLDLTANLLHDEGVQAIASAVKVNQGLTSLHLQWNFMKCSATKALADALLNNTTIQLLDLQENAIGNEGVVCLAQALKTNTSLRTLCLQGVSVGSSGAIAMAEALMTNQSLQTLDLRGNSVGMEGAKALANALKSNRSLKSLNLQENLLGMDGAIFIATALKGNHQVTYINLQGNGLGESGAKVISDAITADAPACVVDI